MKTKFPRLSVSWIGGDLGRADVEIRLESATMRLLAVTGADGWAAASEEVRRREALFAKIGRRSPRRHEHPRIAALESVAHDAAQGRLA